MAKTNRKFGELPEWAQGGPITLKNYDLRMEWYGVKIKQWRDNWPFLSRDPDVRSTADEIAWEVYFRDHLGGFPASWQNFRDGSMRYLNVPEARPELFDMSYGG